MLCLKKKGEEAFFVFLSSFVPTEKNQFFSDAADLPNEPTQALIEGLTE